MDSSRFRREFWLFLFTTKKIFRRKSAKTQQVKIQIGSSFVRKKEIRERFYRLRFYRFSFRNSTQQFLALSHFTIFFSDRNFRLAFKCQFNLRISLEKMFCSRRSGYIVMATAVLDCGCGSKI